LKKNEIKDSPIIIGDGNKFEKETAIGHGATIKKEVHIHDGSKQFEVAPNNATLIEKIAKILINRLGIIGTALVDFISFLGALFGIPIGITSTINVPVSSFTNSTILGDLPKYPEYAMLIFVCGFLSFIAFLIIANALFYFRNSHCENCGKDFALDEIQPRKVRDTKTVDGVYRVVTRFTECKFCHDKRKIKHFFEFHEDNDSQI
jgi:hypothetical protein